MSIFRKELLISSSLLLTLGTSILVSFETPANALTINFEEGNNENLKDAVHHANAFFPCVDNLVTKLDNGFECTNGLKGHDTVDEVVFIWRS